MCLLIPNRESPRPQLIASRRSHRLCPLPLDLVSAEKALRFLERPIPQPAFPFAFRAEFLHVAVLDMLVQIPPIPGREIHNIFWGYVVVYAESCGSVMLGVRCGCSVEANCGIGWCGAGEEGGKQGDDEEQE